MPELPEVETTRRGIAPLLEGECIKTAVVRQPKLRWPVPRGLAKTLAGLTIQSVSRRGKYLLIDTGKGHLILHLGMSGSLRVIRADTPANSHDHVDLVLENGQCLRLRDPRRFGAVLWTTTDPTGHKLLASLGPEPLVEDGDFSGEYLFARSRGRSRQVRDFIMDSHIVVGVGNIYANEALFRAGIDPRRAAGRISRVRYDRLASAIREILAEAIEVGGTTLRDFSDARGDPGYFQQTLMVYGRDGETCKVCGSTVRRVVSGNRSVFFCGRCQR
ncbi:MAG: 5-hydroxymethyluracil DNA glycosylase [Acidithiobacillales bacterium SG8_45]|jgi:formamidopyrimidine-DNA glycosylase|nr:MAG: 5-hydroxymethyluracil DNA glycosylase [Acidithiobacillales bacterium SG8_45]